jgi:lipoprotein-anchoring transpeptidase ErfK/SrfK
MDWQQTNFCTKKNEETKNKTKTGETTVKKKEKEQTQITPEFSLRNVILRKTKKRNMTNKKVQGEKLFHYPKKK